MSSLSCLVYNLNGGVHCWGYYKFSCFKSVMKFQSFDGYCWFLGFFVSVSLISLVGIYYSMDLDSMSVFESGFRYFCFDSVSLYLSLLSLLLCLSFVPIFSSQSFVTRFLICMSVFFSLVSYISIHGLVFWLSYEMSILSLLVLVVLESPYSERYVASWYLLGYIVLSGLPSLACIFFNGFYSGSFNLVSWVSCASDCWLYDLSAIVIAVLFITKVPLPPFHVWLPIVHAEASSVVSMCLSGYVMKLGILGLCRFTTWILPDIVLSSGYVLCIMALSMIFFFCATRELDGKRWLAFLSLSHITIAMLCLSVGSQGSGLLGLVYSLGHGLSAGLVFYMLWLFYEISGSRNWGILKFSISSSLVIRILCVSSLFTCASFPPTLQFFCELFVLLDCGSIGMAFIFVMFIYLFIGALVPMFLVGSLLTRHFMVSISGGPVYNYVMGCVFVCFWCYFLFLLI